MLLASLFKKKSAALPDCAGVSERKWGAKDCSDLTGSVPLKAYPFKPYLAIATFMPLASHMVIISCKKGWGIGGFSSSASIVKNVKRDYEWILEN